MHKKILLAVDGSPTSDKVLVEVVNVAALGTTILAAAARYAADDS